MSFHSVQRIAVTISISLLLPAVNYSYASGQDECLSSKYLSQFSGHYANKEAWEKLRRIKDCTVVRRETRNLVDAVDITKDGEANGIYAWHEGGAVCAQFRGKELWARPVDVPPNPRSKWNGPFIPVGVYKDVGVAYFNRIFGNACFSSDNGEHWCFGLGSIRIGNNKHMATLFPDQSEMPNYGTHVSVDDDSGFWIFVPYRDGWKVFKDTFVTVEGHVDIDPEKDTPWHTLTPAQASNSRAH